MEFSTSDSCIIINKAAITANWKALDALTGRTRKTAVVKTAAVVKADAYGLGAAQIAPALAASGCEIFFVMALNEAVVLRGALNDHGFGDRQTNNEPQIIALGGCHAGQEDDFLAYRITPAINSLEQLLRLTKFANKREAPIPAALHIDTGMSRLGLDAGEADWLVEAITKDANSTIKTLDGLDLCWLMSHLTSSEDALAASNKTQLDAFNALRKLLPDTPCSLANSGGIFLGPEYHFDMTRPGIALYGMHPSGVAVTSAESNHVKMLTPVVQWQARILQNRRAAAGEAVGYNGTHILHRSSRIATIGVGYADGYPRTLGGKGRVEIGGQIAPVIGRISMDTITVDITDINEDVFNSSPVATLLGPHYDLTQMAADAGTIGYEILTQLGQRPRRLYQAG